MFFFCIIIIIIEYIFLLGENFSNSFKFFLKEKDKDKDKERKKTLLFGRAKKKLPTDEFKTSKICYVCFIIYVFLYWYVM